MSSIEARSNKSGPSWRVVWREDGVKQYETFYTAGEAEEFKGYVDLARQHWPHGWIRGRGFEHEIEHDDAPRFGPFALQTINARAKADEGTKATYRRLLINHIDPVLGELPIPAISRFDVAKVSERMIAAGLSQKTVANVHALLSSVLADAVQDRIIDRNPARGAMPAMASTKTEEMCFLSHGEFELIRSHIAGEVNQALATVLVGTGMRWSEATALQVHDVDLLGRRALDVRRAWKRRGALFELGSPKTIRSRRSIDLSSALVDELVPLVSARNPAEFVFTTSESHSIAHANWYHRVWLPALFAARHCDTHRADAVAATAAYRNALRRAKRQGVAPDSDIVPPPTTCGCRGVLTKQPRIHDMRHTHASWLIADKVSLPAIQRRLGHESITTTIDRYGHLAPEHSVEINAAVDRALARR
jgi:integrase